MNLAVFADAILHSHSLCSQDVHLVGTPWLDTRSLVCLTTCNHASQRHVSAVWHAWEAQLRRPDVHFLERELIQLWRRHRHKIHAEGMSFNPLTSAADMYACWPSSCWFKEVALPFQEQIEFEIGDSSYNIWIFKLQAGLPILGRILCDLYLRMEWPGIIDSARRWADAKEESSFVDLAISAARTEWEFQMRSVVYLMDQIWWTSARMERASRKPELKAVLRKRPWLRDGLLLPQRPQPQQGLSLLRGQESVFMTWDRFELWVYGCYVD